MRRTPVSAQELAGQAALALGAGAAILALALAMARHTAFVDVVRDLAVSRSGVLLGLGVLVFHLGLVMVQGGHFLGILTLEFAYPSGVRCGPPTGGC
jgi:hypothetical protein